MLRRSRACSHSDSAGSAWPTRPGAQSRGLRPAAVRRRGAFRRCRFRGAASRPRRPGCSARVRFPTFPSQEVGAAAAGRLSRPACTGASLLTPALVCDEVTNLPNAAQSLRGKGPRRRPSGCWETLPRERGRGSQRDASRPDLSARSQVSLQQGRGRAAASSPRGRRRRRFLPQAPSAAPAVVTALHLVAQTSLQPASSAPSARTCPRLQDANLSRAPPAAGPRLRLPRLRPAPPAPSHR